MACPRQHCVDVCNVSEEHGENGQRTEGKNMNARRKLRELRGRVMEETWNNRVVLAGALERGFGKDRGRLHGRKQELFQSNGKEECGEHSP